MSALVCHPLLVNSASLRHYAAQFNLDPAQALFALAHTINRSLWWRQVGDAVIVAREEPPPALGVLGHFESHSIPPLLAQSRALRRACSSLRYVAYEQVLSDCKQLASALRHRLGSENLETFAFAGLPRGGYIVAGLLAYALGLKQGSLLGPGVQPRRLVVVDDCALTGARFASYLARLEGVEQVVFAHLYSSLTLREQIEKEEPSVIACIAAHDLTEYSEEGLDTDSAGDRGEWFGRLDGRRYSVGQTEHVVFPWSEPDRIIWNSAKDEVEAGWPLAPGRFCFENGNGGEEQAPVVIQKMSSGPLRPAETVIFGPLRGELVVGDLADSRAFGLRGSAAAMWQAIVQTGSMEASVAALAAEYDVEEERLRADLEQFVDNLIQRGLIRA